MNHFFDSHEEHGELHTAHMPIQDHNVHGAALPELIDAQAAIATIAVFCLSSLVGIVIGYVLVKRSFPERFGLYLANDSALHAMIRRSRLLLLTDVFLLLDAGSGAVYYYAVWREHTAKFAAHRLIFACSFLPGCACATLAIIQRCAVILMRDQAWRRRFVRSLGIVCFLACVILQFSACLFVWTMWNEANPSVWFNERRTHIWALPAVALFPIITIVSALLSIKVYNEQGGATSGTRPPDGPAGNTRTDKLARFADRGKWRRPSLATIRSVSRDPELSSTGQSGTHSVSATSAVSSSPSQPSYMVTRKTSKSTPVTRPLTIAFNVMTWCLVLEWVSTMIISTFTSVGIVKSPAVLSLVGSLGIVTESLFETIMQVVHQRVRRDPDDHCVQSNTEDGKSGSIPHPPTAALSTQAVGGVGMKAHGSVISIVEDSVSALGRAESGHSMSLRHGQPQAPGSTKESMPPRLLSRQ